MIVERILTITAVIAICALPTIKSAQAAVMTPGQMNLSSEERGWDMEAPTCELHLSIRSRAFGDNFLEADATLICPNLSQEMDAPSEAVSPRFTILIFSNSQISFDTTGWITGLPHTVSSSDLLGTYTAESEVLDDSDGETRFFIRRVEGDKILTVSLDSKYAHVYTNSNWIISRRLTTAEVKEFETTLPHNFIETL